MARYGSWQCDNLIKESKYIKYLLWKCTHFILPICKTQMSCKKTFIWLMVSATLPFHRFDLCTAGWQIIAVNEVEMCSNQKSWNITAHEETSNYVTNCTSVQKKKICELLCMVSMVMSVSGGILMTESFLFLCRRRWYANGLNTSPDGVCLCPELHRWGQWTCECTCVCLWVQERERERESRRKRGL